MNSWTKDKQTGFWKVIAQGDHWQPGDQVTVTKRDGSQQTVTAQYVSRPFEGKFGPNQGKTCVFITPQRDTGDGQTRGRSVRRYPAKHTSEHCDCGNWAGPGSPCLQAGEPMEY